MLLNEIKVGGVYKASLNVQLRTDKEIIEKDFFIRVTGKTSKGFIEFTFLGSPDNGVCFLNPCQVNEVS